MVGEPARGAGIFLLGVLPEPASKGSASFGCIVTATARLLMVAGLWSAMSS